MRREAPQDVLFVAYFAEIQAVRVDVANLAELPCLEDLLQLPHARVVLEQMPDHEDQSGALRRRRNLSRLVRRLGHGLLDEAVLARRERRQRKRGVRGHVGGDDHCVESVVGEQVVEARREEGARKLRSPARESLL